MSEQLTMIGPDREPKPPTDRQAFLLDQLRRLDGLSGEEAGAWLHERNGRHNAGARCDWCARDGLGALRALRKKGYVRSNRQGIWRALNAGEPQTVAKEPGRTNATVLSSRAAEEGSSPALSAPYDPATADWPEGF